LREPGLRLVLATVFEIPGAASGPLQRRGELSWPGNIVIARNYESIAWLLWPHGRASGCVLDLQIAKHVSSRPVVGLASVWIFMKTATSGAPNSDARFVRRRSLAKTEKGNNGVTFPTWHLPTCSFTVQA